MEEFQLSKFTKEGAQLLREVTEEFNRLGLDTSKLPKTFPDDNDKIKLVFVGQYSAGKSSIIKMLTSAEVEIGAAITTQTSTPYEWNGLEIIDTPGIHTELRPDHDEITYDQINHAALLIFVITNEGFSQRMGRHFRLLAIEGKRAANMVLVVNKMDRTTLGNVLKQQQIIYEDLKKVTAPYDPNDLYISFVDTASYFKAMKETDERRKNKRLEQSGHDTFIANLNRFVEQKGILQKINLPLNIIVAEIKNASSSNLSDMEKEDFRAYKETLLHKQKIIRDRKKECAKDIEEIISDFRTDVAIRGRIAAENATSAESEEDAKAALKKAETEIAGYVKICQTKISERIKTFGEETTAELQAYDNSPFVHQVNRKISEKFNFTGENKFSQARIMTDVSDSQQKFDQDKNFDGKYNIEGASEVTQNVANIVGAGGMAAGAFAFQFGAQIAEKFAEVAITPLGHAAGFAVNVGVESVLNGVLQGADFGIISNYVGKGAGNFVKNISWFKEEPNLLNKFAGKFTGNGSKFLGGALALGGAMLSAYMTHREGKKAEEAEQKIHKAQEDIISSFNNYAKNIGNMILYGKKEDNQQGVLELLNQNIDPFIVGLDKAINSIDAMTLDDKIKNRKLSALLKRTEKFIGEIQACK